MSRNPLRRMGDAGRRHRVRRCGSSSATTAGYVTGADVDGRRRQLPHHLTEEAGAPWTSASSPSRPTGRRPSPSWPASRGAGLTSLYHRRRPHAHPGEPRHAVPGGGDLPDEYRRSLDPIVALDAAAAATTRSASARASTSPPSATRSTRRRRSPRSTICAGGRIEFGVGYGWNVEEAGRPWRRMEDAARRSYASRCWR